MGSAETFPRPVAPNLTCLDRNDGTPMTQAEMRHALGCCGEGKSYSIPLVRAAMASYGLSLSDIVPAVGLSVFAAVLLRVYVLTRIKAVLLVAISLLLALVMSAADYFYFGPFEVPGWLMLLEFFPMGWAIARISTVDHAAWCRFRRGLRSLHLLKGTYLPGPPLGPGDSPPSRQSIWAGALLFVSGALVTLFLWPEDKELTGVLFLVGAQLWIAPFIYPPRTQAR